MLVSQPCVHRAIDTCLPSVSTLVVGVGIGPRLDENEFPDLVLGSLPKFSKNPFAVGSRGYSEPAAAKTYFHGRAGLFVKTETVFSLMAARPSIFNKYL